MDAPVSTEWDKQCAALTFVLITKPNLQPSRHDSMLAAIGTCHKTAADLQPIADLKVCPPEGFKFRNVHAVPADASDHQFCVSAARCHVRNEQGRPGLQVPAASGGRERRKGSNTKVLLHVVSGYTPTPASCCLQASNVPCLELHQCVCLGGIQGCQESTNCSQGCLTSTTTQPQSPLTRSPGYQLRAFTMRRGQNVVTSALDGLFIAGRRP